ncbi:transmembrane protein [Perilla frutescens var. hirtella]|uniref:Transmembrane protein n=1 Tax=Perilla frutescens var. hirtella TaxID=608512 RepID=A0AAD4IXD5_PERFH|nr:transmembrane protein [Perilla frutescens var. hirtella]
MAARFKELMKKYGKVGVVVHCSVSAASISGLYLAIKNNVDVESMLERVGLSNLAKDKSKDSGTSDNLSENPEIITKTDSEITVKEKNRTAELAASSGGALALAILLNKALFPIRVPITLAVTPPVARFLARRNLINKSV